MYTEPQTPSDKQTLFKSIFLIEIGLIEIGIVLLVLSLLFGILNYFNILKISEVIPFFNFLPHKEITIPSFNLSNNVTLSFDIDTFEQFAIKNVHSSYLPFKLGSLPFKNFPNRKITTWDTDNNAFTAVGSLVFAFTRDKTLQHINEMDIKYLLKSSTNSFGGIDIETADKYTSLLFIIDSHNSWNCKTESSVSLCQKQYSDDGGKGYYGIFQNSFDKSKGIFICYYPKSSTLVTLATACL